ncbi:hypothetical protein HZH68_014981 [Vespula germanica]|uniref:Double jelly roll-like domain-containing protein n=1 Tax=Vespula germanica TaxID=30212 RepID=A0A834MRX4_VESGE|nr:hypothetical protein HZH68_014981 [Vespula germanica]
MEDLNWFMKSDSSSPTAEDGQCESRIYLDNNGIVCMFNEIRRKTKGIEVDNSKNIGINWTLKNYLSLDNDKSKQLKKLHRILIRLKNFYYESLEYSLPLLLLQIKNFNNTNPNRLLALKQVKSNMIDVKIEFRYAKNIVPNTTAYCFIDDIIKYNPLTNSTIVRTGSFSNRRNVVSSFSVQHLPEFID